MINKYLIGGLLLAAVALALQQWRITAAQSKADHYQQRAQTLSTNYNQAQQVITTMQQQMAAQLKAQNKLNQQLATLKQSANDQQNKLTEALHADTELKHWADQPLPAAARRLLF
ncbi:hypothetical protein [Celerinatantimonas sp. YJH-8]|uniref:hypothetical protein n=1 Tax=Celerinatantimonas sp. YJH-8 TaxID=3228714 RepID=UPI0038C90A3D